MSELLTLQDLANGHLDVKALGEAANGDENTIVTTRTGNTYPSAERAINIMFKNGGLPATPFATKALMTASALVDGDYAQVTDDTVNNGLYVKTAGAWVKSGYDPLTQANQYADNLLTTELSIATDLNTLAAGNYFLSTANLNALVDAGNFIELGYPADTVKKGGLKLNVVRKDNFTYQTLEFTHQGRILTRQGAIGSSFYDWVEVGGLAVSKKFGTVTAGTSLNTFINAGTWGISGAIVLADSKVPEMGYPETMAASSAVLTVAQTASNYAVQEFTHGITKYKRILHRATAEVYEDWQVLGVGVGNGAVAASENLNDYKTAGIYAISTGVLKVGVESGEMSLPNFFTAVGGAILIVAKAGNYPYQVIIGTRQKKIASRQGDGNVWTAWENILDISPTFATPKKTFLTYGSSSFYYMSAKIKTRIESFNATYISDAIGGQILETMQAHQGSNPISIVFNDGVTALNNVASAVTVTQKDDIGSLTAKGSFTVTLSNGLKGTLNLDANTFTASNASESYEVGSLSFHVDFGYLDYAQTAYHIFNIGKNNITMGSYTTQQLVDETVRMIDFIEDKNNQNFIVVGHFVDRNMASAQKQTVLEVNAALKAKYGMKYFDMQDYLMSAQIWTDLNITPTQDDLDKQAAGELAVSLSRDAKHLSADVDTIFATKIVNKIQTLGYLT